MSACLRIFSVFRISMDEAAWMAHNVFPMVTNPEWIPARSIHNGNKYPIDLKTCFQNGNHFYLIWILQGNEIWGLGNGYYSGQSERVTLLLQSRQNSIRFSRQGRINDGSQEPDRSLFFIHSSRTLYHRPRIFISRFNTLSA